MRDVRNRDAVGVWACRPAALLHSLDSSGVDLLNGAYNRLTEEMSTYEEREWISSEPHAGV